MKTFLVFMPPVGGVLFCQSHDVNLDHTSELRKKGVKWYVRRETEDMGSAEFGPC